MASFWMISLLLGVTFVQLLLAGPLEIVALKSTNSPSINQIDNENLFIPDDDSDQLTDQICGEHPLKTIVRKIEESQPEITQQEVVRLLALMRVKAPKLWNSYQQNLVAYVNCKVMSAGGSLG